MAVLLGLTVLRPAAPPTVPVLVAARDLPGGAAVAPGDLRLAGWPATVAPDGALRATPDATGRVLAGPLRRGEAVTDARLVGAGALGGAGTPGSGPPGAVGLPVRFADPGAVALLRPGDRVDVLAAPVPFDALDVFVPPSPGSAATAARVVAADVTVLTVPRAEADQGPADAANGGLVVLAVPRDAAAEVAGAAALSPLTYVMRPAGAPTSTVAVTARGQQNPPGYRVCHSRDEYASCRIGS